MLFEVHLDNMLELSTNNGHLITPHAQRDQGKDRYWSPYTHIGMFGGQKKN